jgi:hypothetical protein
LDSRNGISALNSDVEDPAGKTLIFLVPAATETYPLLFGNVKALVLILLLSTAISTPGASGDACTTINFAFVEFASVPESEQDEVITEIIIAKRNNEKRVI